MKTRLPIRDYELSRHFLLELPIMHSTFCGAVMKIKRIIEVFSKVCLFWSCLLPLSCTKKSTKPSPKCIYDQPVFAQVCLEAVSDESRFLVFKQNPYFNLLWENRTEEEGVEDIKWIELHAPFVFEHLEKLRAIDAIGSPRVYSYGEYGALSPYTLHLAAFSGEIAAHCGDLSGKRIVQIGAGYGGLCQVIQALFPVDSYTLIDLPEQLELAKKYLSCAGIEQVSYLTPDQLPEGISFDVLLSDQSFSEFNRHYQEIFVNKLFCHSHSGYVRGHLFPKHFGVVALNCDELIKILKRKMLENPLQLEEPEHDRGAYLIRW